MHEMVLTDTTNPLGIGSRGVCLLVHLENKRFSKHLADSLNTNTRKERHAKRCQVSPFISRLMPQRSFNLVPCYQKPSSSTWSLFIYYLTLDMSPTYTLSAHLSRNVFGLLREKRRSSTNSRQQFMPATLPDPATNSLTIGLQEVTSETSPASGHYDERQGDTIATNTLR